jgi:hypothetical protein
LLEIIDDVTQQLLRSSFCGLSLDLLLVLRSVISDGQHDSANGLGEKSAKEARKRRIALYIPVHLICLDLRRIRNVGVIEEILDTET